MTYSNAMQEPEANDDELWAVRLPSGGTRVMSLEQLDAAFQAGEIDGDTLVIESGGAEWVRLGDIAGLEGPTEHSDVHPTYGHAGAYPNGGHAHDAYVPQQAQSYGYVPQQPAYAQSYDGYVPQAQSYCYVPQQHANSYAPGPFDHANSVAPVAMQAHGYDAPFTSGLNSMRPVVSEVSEMEIEGFGPKKGKAGKIVFAVAALALLGAGGFVASTNPAVTAMLNRSSAATTSNVAAAVAPAAPPPAMDVTPGGVAAGSPSPATEPGPAAGSLGAALTEPAPIPAAPKLTEAQKKQLAAAEKKAKLGKKSGKGAKGGASTGAPSLGGKKKGGSPFHNGGNEYDPLNAAL